MKTIIVKKPTRIMGRNVCLNCGADLRKRKIRSKFCCSMCKSVYEFEHGGKPVYTSKSDFYMTNVFMER